MNIWNKVLLGLIFVASLGFFYLSARTLKTHQHWRELARRCEQRIQQVEKENDELLSGNAQQGENAKCIRTYQAELTRLVTDRGRVWHECMPEKPKPTGEVSVAIGDKPAPDGVADKPVPHGIADKTVLYVFEEADAAKGGRYLGQFVVSEAADKQVVLKPVRPLSPRELQRLINSQGKWAFYERMPFDNHDAFAALSEAEKKTLLPADTVTEYLKDGQPADAGDPEDRAADGKYVRQLRDYRVLFERQNLERVQLSNLCDADERNRDQLRAAATDAKKQIGFRKQEIAGYTAELQRDRLEAGTVGKLYDALQHKVAELTTGVTQMIATNKSLAAGIAKIQLEAAQRIDARTQAMVQSTESRK